MIQDIFYKIDRLNSLRNRNNQPDAFQAEIDEMKKLTLLIKPNQFFFVRISMTTVENDDTNNALEMEKWLKENLPNRYRIYRQQYEDKAYFYKVLDFGEDTAAAALFKLFQS